MARVVSHSDDRRLLVRIELTGIDPVKDVRLAVRDRTLEIDVRHVDNGSTEHVAQRVSLPDGVTEDDLRITVADNVLEISAEAQ